MAGDSDQTSRKERAPNGDLILKAFLSMGIVVFLSVAGGIWGELVNNSANASALGGLAGFSLGVALVMAARLARMK